MFPPPNRKRRGGKRRGKEKMEVTEPWKKTREEGKGRHLFQYF